MIMCVIIADIYLVPCAKASENGRFISTKRVNSVCFSWGHGRAVFPVAYCLVLSGHNQSLRLQRTQPIPSSMSLLRELAPLPSHPCTCGVSPSLDSLREEASGLSPNLLEPFPFSPKLRSAVGCLKESGMVNVTTRNKQILSCCAVPGGASRFCVRYELSFQHTEPDLWGISEMGVWSLFGFVPFLSLKWITAFIYLFILLIFWSIIVKNIVSNIQQLFSYIHTYMIYIYLYIYYLSYYFPLQVITNYWI